MSPRLPTIICIEFAGGEPSLQRLEGRSLMPLLRGETPTNWRDFVICEEDYSPLTVRHHLNLPINDARATMIRTERWKYILHEAFRPELYDMENDPQEQNDLGEDPAYANIRQDMHERLFRWFRHRALRLARPDSFTMTRSQPGWVEEKAGVMIGHW